VAVKQAEKRKILCSIDLGERQTKNRREREVEENGERNQAEGPREREGLRLRGFWGGGLITQFLFIFWPNLFWALLWVGHI